MIITLVGSTKFQEDFERINHELSVLEHCVFTVSRFGHKTGLDMAGKEKKALDRGYLKKIEASEAICVINPNGYIGMGGWDEILYAFSLNKQIIVLEPLDKECMQLLGKLGDVKLICTYQYFLDYEKYEWVKTNFKV